MICLFQNYYTDKDKDRNNELRVCLQKNINNPLIDKIYLLSEESIFINNKKIIKVPANKRPTYSDFFNYINSIVLSSDISIISNSDIYFDSTLSLLTPFSDNTCYALCRWDGDTFYNHSDSQDAWIFKGKIKDIKDLDFGLGIAGCDNAIAYKIEQAGYNILNPSKSIRAIHLHNTEVRNYIQNGKVIKRIPPPYKQIAPTELIRPNEKKKDYRIMHIGFPYSNSGQRAIHDAFKEQGEFLHIDWQKELKMRGLEGLRKFVIEENKKFCPHLVFMQLQTTTDVINADTVKQMSGIIINWSGDMRENIAEWIFEVGKHIDCTMYSDNYSVEKLKERGINAEFLPTGYNEKDFCPSPYKEIVFLAQNYAKDTFPLTNFRFQMTNKVQEHFGDRFGLYGGGWKNADNLMSNVEKESAVLRHSKIAINLSQFNTFRYTSDRLWRAMGSGTCVLTHRFRDIDYFFQDKQEVVMWDSIDDLIEKIEYYLQHEEERKAIAIRGYEWAKNNATYHHIIKKVIDYAKKTQKEKDKWIPNLQTLDLSQNKYSQTGEEVIIKYIFEKIGITNKYLVDIGAGDGIMLSNSKLLIDEGWTGTLIDGDNKGNDKVKKEFVTRENIMSLFYKYDVPKNFDLLSIDVDGNDFYVLEEILKHCNPRLIVSEFNPAIEDKKVIKYNPDHRWNNDTYYGYSFEAGKELAGKYGYVIIYNHKNLNLFYLRKDLCDDIPNVDFQKRIGHKSNNTGEWVTLNSLLPNEKRIMPFQELPFNGDHFICKEFIKLRDKFQSKTAIELGTATGGTAKWLGENFHFVHTIEIRPDFLEIAKQRCSGLDNILFYEGSTIKWLPEILTICKDVPIIFIDSHWQNHFPLYDELKIIKESGLKPIIAIHDCLVPDNPELGYDSYNSLPICHTNMKNYLDDIYGEGKYFHYYNSQYTEIKRGIIYVTPIS